MGNVNLPTPVALAGAGLCLLAGYIVGAVVHPSGQDRTTAEVKTFNPDNDALCLTGEAVAPLANTDDNLLCGTWRRDAGSTDPQPGDEFAFVTMTSTRGSDGEKATFIFGEVVR